MPTIELLTGSFGRFEDGERAVYKRGDVFEVTDEQAQALVGKKRAAYAGGVVARAVEDNATESTTGSSEPEGDAIDGASWIDIGLTPNALRALADNELTRAHVREMSDDDLIKIKGIGRATIAKIRESI